MSKIVLQSGGGLSGKGIWTIILMVLAILGAGSGWLYQYNQAEQAKADAKIELNNHLALEDSVRTILKEKDNALFEKSALQLKVNQLDNEKKDLIKRLELSKKKTPKTVIQYVTVYKESIKNIPSTIQKNENGGESISFVYNPKLPGKNALRISGQVPYDLKITQDANDSSKYKADLLPGLASLNILQNIELTTGIYQDPDSKRILTRVSTTFPGLRFSEINAFDITDNPETKRALKAARKHVGVGFIGGFGYNFGVAKPGVFLGVGLHYSPKGWQF